MDKHDSNAQLRDKIAKLFADAGYSLPELLEYIEQLEQKIERLEDEQKKLKAAAKRQQPSTSMSSRLKDALRE